MGAYGWVLWRSRSDGTWELIAGDGQQTEACQVSTVNREEFKGLIEGLQKCVQYRKPPEQVEFCGDSNLVVAAVQ